MSLLAGWYLWQRMMLALGLGAVAALGLAPMSLWLATIGALLALPALFLASPGWRQAAWTDRKSVV